MSGTDQPDRLVISDSTLAEVVADVPRPAVWTSPGSDHAPGTTISICPLCGWEYEHPPVTPAPAEVRRSTGDIQDVVAVAVRSTLIAHARLMERDLAAHFVDLHGLWTAREVEDMVRRCGRG